MYQAFEEFEGWLQSNYEEGFRDLNPPATDREIEELESALDVSLPEDFIDLLKVHDGQNGNAGWLLDGQEFLSSHRIIDEWKLWEGALDGGDFEGSSSEPQDGIKDNWWNKRWVPFTDNGSGDHCCLDLDPAESGTAGQIITMRHDSAERELLSPSLADWFESYVERLLLGDFVYSEEYGAIVSKDDT